MGAVHSSDSLVISYEIPGAGVDVGGKRLKQLPPSVSSMFKPENATGAGSAPSLGFVVKKTPYVVVGAYQCLQPKIEP